MDEPRASRPHMPGYGIQAADAGSGLMPWAEAERLLTESGNYWLATVGAVGWAGGGVGAGGGAGGVPHLMPVWGVWQDGVLWFSSSLRSRKIRNLRASPRCTASTEDADNPVVVSGVAAVVDDRAAIAAFLDAMNAKYHTEYGIDFLDPAVNATVRLAVEWAFALRQEDFSGSPTRWRF